MSSVATAGLRLPAAVANQVLSHARDAQPNEACGLLAGDAASGEVRAFHRARNERASPRRFSIAPEDLVRLTYAIEAAGLEMVAIFHSHPSGPAMPSPTDIREARYPDALHLVAGRGGRLRAWQIRDGAATEVLLTIEDRP